MINIHLTSRSTKAVTRTTRRRGLTTAACEVLFHVSHCPIELLRKSFSLEDIFTTYNKHHLINDTWKYDGLQLYHPLVLKYATSPAREIISSYILQAMR
jgi:hypothetical protein